VKSRIPFWQRVPRFIVERDKLVYWLVCDGANDVVCIDITHPIPDLTGYITEGQIYVDRQLHNRQVSNIQIQLLCGVFNYKKGIGTVLCHIVQYCYFFGIWNC